MPKIDLGYVIGPKGDTGDAGPQGVQGIPGPQGEEGRTAYQYAVDAGYTGTEGEFSQALASIDTFASESELEAHTGNTNNPHSVTAAQIGAQLPVSASGTGYYNADTDRNVEANRIAAIKAAIAEYGWANLKNKQITTFIIRYASGYYFAYLMLFQGATTARVMEFNPDSTAAIVNMYGASDNGETVAVGNRAVAPNHTHTKANITDLGTIGAAAAKGVTDYNYKTYIRSTDENLVTARTVVNHVYYSLNRENRVPDAETNYTTYMARGEALNSSDTNPTANGAISWTYA